MKIWDLKRLNLNAECLTEKFNISPILETVLYNRGISTVEDAKVYLNPGISFMHNAFEMKDLPKALEIIEAAIKERKKIFIYGDYDVDGVCSTVILYKGLKASGADAHYYIPHREEEGYGLNCGVVEKLKEKDCDLIFTCDNGIASIEEVKLIKKLGMNIIILDHHEPQFTQDEQGNREYIIPEADAVIDNKQEDCNYPFKELCAAGMSYKFIEAFFEYQKKSLDNKAELFAFAAIGTVCDIVNLKDENRILVRNGLKLINHRKNLNLGLTELIKCREIEEKKITETSIGFILGPCINASGRLETALEAVELFTTEDNERAKVLAQRLSDLNNERRKLTEDSFERIINGIESSSIKDNRVFVVYDKDVHESIAGIVAGRVKDRYYRPTILITEAVECDKGSGRSIEGYNLFEALLECKDLFERFGGHSMAAGLSLKHENVEILSKRLNEKCRLTEEDLTEKLHIDKQLDFKDINLRLASELDLLRPTGKDNRNPYFLSKNIEILNINFVGAKKNVTQFQFKQSGIVIRGINFNDYECLIESLNEVLSEEDMKMLLQGIKRKFSLKADIVYTIDINEYNGTKSVQLMVADFRIY